MALKLVKGGAKLSEIRSAFPAKIQKQWEAKRVRTTESTRLNSMKFMDTAKKIGQRRYAIEHGSSKTGPCELCRSKGLGNHNVSGGDMPPYHPNCRCVAH